jgi:membrane fusion protein, multidrug efflux system
MSSSNRVQTKPNRRGRALAILALLAVIAIFAVRFASVGRTQIPPSIASVQAEQGIPVETVTLAPADMETWITVAGTVEGIVQYPIVSNNALRVAGIPVREGDPVHPGDVVVRLAREAPTPMVHSYQKARASFDNTLREVQRLRALFAAGAVSEQVLDQAETRLEVARVDLEDAEGSTSLVANQAGIVSRVLVREGETVSAGKALAWITRTDSVKIVFEVGSQQAMALREGQRARWASAESGRSGEGRIARVDLMADPKTHLLEGAALFPNPAGSLVPGLLVSVRVLTGHREQAPAVPRECILTSAEGDYVYTLDRAAAGTPIARRTPVQTGLRTSDRVEIVGGLHPGAEVVRYGQSKLADGDRVHVVNTSKEI